MFTFILNWLKKRRVAWSSVPVPEKNTSHGFQIQKQVHLHWHVSDSSQIPQNVIWNAGQLVTPNVATVDTTARIYDKELLERVRMQWQFGEWETLSEIDVLTVEQHPDRAKIALVVASAWLQLGDSIQARKFTQHAKEWGCDKKLIAQLLIAGVHNTLGRVASLNGDEVRAMTHFRDAVKGVSGDSKLASQVRIQHELGKLDSEKNANAVFQTKQQNLPKITVFPAQQKVLQLMRDIHPRAMRTMKKIRIGGMNDGGYVVPECILKCDTVLSIGIGNDVSFDLELANQGMTVLQFDHTVDGSPTVHFNFVFEKKGWGNCTEGDLLDFNEIFTRFQARSPQRGALKFDIEGAEFDALAATDVSQLADFEVIVCEIHWLENLVDSVFFDRVRHAIDKLTTYHVPIHLHANNCSNVALVEGLSIPQVLEISFLRRDLDTFDGLSLESIPGYLDQSNNPAAPDIYMSLFIEKPTYH
jgi:hypothetical protein